jgi:hypothetical protein
MATSFSRLHHTAPCYIVYTCSHVRMHIRARHMGPQSVRAIHQAGGETLTQNVWTTSGRGLKFSQNLLGPPSGFATYNRGSSPNPLWRLEENICKQTRHSRINIPTLIFVAFRAHMTSLLPHLISVLTSAMSAGLLSSCPKYTHILNLSFSVSCSLSGLFQIVHCLIGVSYVFFCKRL